MHNNDEHGPKEWSSPLVFVPVALIGMYLIYLVAAMAFRAGAEKGRNDAVISPPPVEEAGPVEEEVFDMRQLMKPNEEMMALGSKVYANNCAACHGAEGNGQGAAGQALAVKPRNFHAGLGDWKNGASALQMYDTLEKGLGSMPNFPALNMKQKMATIHYIHSEFMGGNFPADSPEALAAMPAPAAGASTKIDSYKQPRVPVEYAIRKLTAGSGNASAPAPVQSGHGESH